MSKASKLQSRIPGLDNLLEGSMSLDSKPEMASKKKNSVVSILLSITDGESFKDELGTITRDGDTFNVQLNNDAWFETVFTLTGDADSAMSIVEYLQNELKSFSKNDQYRLLSCLRGETLESELTPETKEILYSLKSWVTEEVA